MTIGKEGAANRNGSYGGGVTATTTLSPPLALRRRRFFLSPNESKRPSEKVSDPNRAKVGGVGWKKRIILNTYWDTSSACEGRLFPGGGQYEHFMNCLHGIVEKCSEELKAALIRQGKVQAATQLRAQLCLHRWCRFVYEQCGASKRYLQYEKAGDQYLGCWYVASMSTINRLPHRHHSLILIMNLESRADDIYTLIKDYMVQGYHISARVHRIFYCCFASLRFHHCHSWWRWQRHSTRWRRRWQCSRQRSIHHCSSEWEETKV